MKYIYFIEINGVKHYKLDTLWSKSIDITHSKVYGSIEESLLKSFLYVLTHMYDNYPLRYDEAYNCHNGALLGYQTIDENQLHTDNKYILVDNPIILDSAYLFYLTSKKDGTNYLTDYKKINRENKLKNILNIIS